MAAVRIDRGTEEVQMAVGMQSGRAMCHGARAGGDRWRRAASGCGTDGPMHAARDGVSGAGRASAVQYVCGVCVVAPTGKGAIDVSAAAQPSSLSAHALPTAAGEQGTCPPRSAQAVSVSLTSR